MRTITEQYEDARQMLDTRFGIKLESQIQKLITKCQKRNPKRKIKLCGINGEHWWKIEGKDESQYSESISFLALDWDKYGEGYEPKYELFRSGRSASIHSYRYARAVFNQFYELVQVHHLLYQCEDWYSLFGTITATEVNHH